VPSAGDAYPNWTLEHFKEVVDRAATGQAAVLQFHGVPDVQHPWVNTPEDRFRAYMNYLLHGGFHVIALRDLLPYLPEKPVDNDAMARTQYPARSGDSFFWSTETEQTREKLDFWLPDMARDHGYTLEEMTHVSALPKRVLEERLTSLGKASAFAGETTLTKL